MRILAVLTLTVCQFTAFPFMSMVAANTARIMEARSMEESREVRHIALQQNVTTIYKTNQL
ncbi:MAG: hypothetical protein IOC86_04685 [Aestuariivirga sp.]|nr:hypothetical protein [Aestuariivirga sp.]